MILNDKNKIDQDFDDIFKAHYSLYKCDFNSLADYFKNENPIYKNIDVSNFNSLSKYNTNHDDLTNKVGGLATSIFYAYNDDGKIYLLDGYRRLFTQSEETKNINFNTYIKVFSGPLTNPTLFKMLFAMNLWKNNSRLGRYNYELKDFFDRGFRLFSFVKFNINMDFEYQTGKPSFDTLLFSYFTDVRYSGSFQFKRTDFKNIITKETFIDDLYELDNIAKTYEKNFPNKNVFLEETLGFMSYLRNNGFDGKLTYQMFEDKLKQNTKFFNKLVKMYGNEATNKSILNFLFTFKSEFINEI